MNTGSKAFSKRKVSWKECLERIYLKRTCDSKDLEEFIDVLRSFLKESNKVFFMFYCEEKLRGFLDKIDHY